MDTPQINWTEKPRCCAEIGSIRNGWHECGRLARVFSDREYQDARYRLFFCSQHAAKATKADHARIVRTGEV